MELYLVRHAVAGDREEFAQKNPEDHLRPITLKGRKKLQKVAMKLLDLIEEVDFIVTSPYLRAMQSAEVISQLIYEVPIKKAAELVPASIS